MTDPNYLRQPTTLDPGVEIPKDAPLGQGQTKETAARTREAAEEHKQAVQDARPELGEPRAPGDHAEKKAKKDDEKKS